MLSKNTKWVADITYVPLKGGWAYLAVVLDLYSRKVVGWSMEAEMTTELVLQALKYALCFRAPETRILLHTDQGCQFTSVAWSKIARQNNLELSMSRRGNCYDNAVMERFFGSLKSEWIRHRVYAELSHASLDVSEYITQFYNDWRPHSYLGGLSPNQFENSLEKVST